MGGIQSELTQFGLTVYNANVKQLIDAPGSEYFTYLRLKSQEGAINQAKVDVANAKCMGAVGEKEKVSRGEQELSIALLLSGKSAHRPKPSGFLSLSTKVYTCYPLMTFNAQRIPLTFRKLFKENN